MPKRIHVLLVACVLVTVPMAASAETPEERKAIARRVVDEILNQGRYELAAELYAEDFVNHAFARDYTLQEDLGAAREWKSAFPDGRMTVEKLLADGEYVVVLWRGEGTNTGTGRGLPATGKRYAGRGITIWRISGGKIREEWSKFDQAGILVELGLLVPAQAN